MTNVANDTAHLANTAQAAKTALHVDKLEAVADRGYFDGEEILACEQGGITVTLPKPQRSGAKSEGRFGKQDFVYLADEDVYRCPAGEKLKYRFTAEEHGQKLWRYWTDACGSCAIKDQCTTGKQRRITRWEHEDVVEAVQERLDKNPDAMRTRRETVEHPFGTMKMRMGARPRPDPDLSCLALLQRNIFLRLVTMNVSTSVKRSSEGFVRVAVTLVVALQSLRSFR